ASATIAISGSFVGSGDSLFVLDGATHLTSGIFTGTNITVSETTDASGNQTLTLTGADTFADYQAALNAVRFTNTSENPTDYGTHLTRTLTWSVSDGLLSNQTPVTTTLTVNGVNDAPVNTAPATRTVNEDTALTFTAGNTISVADPDNQSLT